MTEAPRYVALSKTERERAGIPDGIGLIELADGLPATTFAAKLAPMEPEEVQ